MATAAPRDARAPRLLIIEDDEDIANLLGHALRKAGFEVGVMLSGAGVVARVREHPPDLLLLDVMLPGLDGRDICRTLRADAQTRTVPIIMITARAEEQERNRGTRAGADDYITKPFSPREVVARVRAVLRRAAALPPQDTSLSFGDVHVDLERHVDDRGREVRLTRKSSCCCATSWNTAARVARPPALGRVGLSIYRRTRTVDVHVRRLREKLPSLADAIVTVPHSGKLGDSSG